MSDAESERIADLNITKRIQETGYAPLKVIDEVAAITKHEDGCCPYFSDNGCDIHREAGGQAKPRTCQIFPFGAVNTPDGYFVSTSFSCPAVITGSGDSIAEQKESLQNLIVNTPELYSECIDQVKLTEEFSVPWTDYLQLESELILKKHWTHPVEELALLAAWIAKHSVLGAVPSSIPETFRHSVVYEETLNILPLFVVNIISIFEFPEDYESRGDLVSQILSTGGRSSQIVSGGTLPVFRIGRAQDLITQSLIDRYLEGQIFGKRLLAGTSVVARLLLLSASVSILLYYLEVWASSRSNPTLDFYSLEWSFDLIESSLVTHSSDLDGLFVEFEKTVLAYAAVDEEEAA